MPDPEAHFGMLLARSSSEQIDMLGVEADVLSEPASFLTPTYEELVHVMTHATAKLKIDWSVEREEIAPSRLD